MDNLATQAQSASIEQFISSLPKAELHVHLEGSVDADTLWELAVQNGSRLAAGGRESLGFVFQTSDFSNFLLAFKNVCLHLQSGHDYELITYRALKKLAAQNVQYVEMIISAGVMIWRGQAIEPLFTGAVRGAKLAHREFGIQTRWIFDIVRQFPVEHAWHVVRAAVNLTNEGVIGIGIGGEESISSEKFGEVFQFGNQQDLHCVAHAGEAAGPESIWGALRFLGAERIGHGLTAVQDKALVRFLADQSIPVEVCLTSNVCTGGIKKLAEHPLRTYFDAGIPVSLHTDDPALFGTTLLREYEIAHDVFGFSRDELLQLARNSFATSFLPPDEKSRFIQEV
jgi:aminodeoxyfutalosine deaminase